MKNKVLSLIVILILSTTLVACNSGQNQEAPVKDNGSSTQLDSSEDQLNDNSDQDGQGQSQVQENKDTEDKKEEIVKVYYSDSQAENLVEKETKLNLDKGQSLEELLVEKLKENTGDPETSNTIREDIKINSVKVEDGVATVDVSSENLSGGSTEEILFIDSVVLTLTNLENVDKVQFLIDGEKKETLMGHMEIADPFSKDDINSTIIKSK